ncbi:hypothetical protein [Aliiroseovarius crassostreae]|nr:hypothetical protein [Aliiroseovarius crassostreae]
MAKIRVLAVLILVLVLPTFMSLLWHRLSGDPMMRPLGLTKEALQDEGEGLIIYADLQLDPDDPSIPNPAAFRKAVQDGFLAKGVQVTIRPGVSDNGSVITYRIGPSTIGPLPAVQAVKGINAAVAAYRMNVPVNK